MGVQYSRCHTQYEYSPFGVLNSEIGDLAGDGAVVFLRNIQIGVVESRWTSTLPLIVLSDLSV